MALPMRDRPRGVSFVLYLVSSIHLMLFFAYLLAASCLAVVFVSEFGLVCFCMLDLCLVFYFSDCVAGSGHCGLFMVFLWFICLISFSLLCSSHDRIVDF